jgi:hypothetical protein
MVQDPPCILTAILSGANIAVYFLMNNLILRYPGSLMAVIGESRI